MTVKKLTQIVVFFLLGIIILPEVLPLNVFIYPFLPEAEKSIGRKISIDGFVRLRLFPYVRLVVNGVRVENIKDAKHKDMLNIESVVAHVDFFSLLRQKVVISGRIVQPVINLQTFPKNKDNWTFTPQPEPQSDGSSEQKEASKSQEKSSWEISVRELKVSGGHVEYRTPDGVQDVIVKTAAFGAKDVSEGPYFVHARLGLNGDYYDLALRTKGKLSAPKTPFYSEVADRKGRFDVQVLGDLIMKTLQVNAKATINASMQRLGLNEALLRYKAVHPRSHVVVKSNIGASAKSVALQNTSIAIPMTTIKGQAAVKLEPKLSVDLNFKTPDEASFLKLKTEVQPEQLLHNVLLNISHMKTLLGLYGVESPVEKDANFNISGDLIQKGDTYAMRDTTIKLDDAVVDINAYYGSVNGRMNASGDVHVKTLRKWWRIFNKDNLPGLNWVKVSARASEKPSDVIDFSSQINMQDKGMITAEGIKNKDIVKANVEVAYHELQDLAHQLTGDKSYKMGPFKFSAKATHSPVQTSLEGVTFNSKPINGTGNIIIETKAADTHVTSDFKLQNLNITNLLELVDDDDGDETVERYKPETLKDKAKKQAAKSPIAAKIVDPGWPRKPIPWPQNLKVNARVDVGNVTLVQPLIKESSFVFDLDKTAKVRFKGTSALAHKPCHLNVDVVPSDSHKDIKIDMALNELPFNSIMGNVTDVISFGGALTALAKISMAGASMNDLMKSLSGNISIASKGAFIDGVNLIKLSRRPESILGLAMQLLFKKSDPGVQKALGFFSLKSKNNKDRTEILKLQAKLPIRSGNARFTDTVLEAEGLKGGIQGYVDLGGRYVDTKGSFELPEVKLKDMPPIKFHAKGSFADVHVDHTADKLKDYFLSNVIGSLVGRGVAQGLLSVLLPGVGTAIGIAAGEAIDRARDSAVDAEIEKERKEKATNGTSSADKPTANQPTQQRASSSKPASTTSPNPKRQKDPIKGIEKDLKKALGGLFG